MTEVIGLRNEVARLERELARAREGALSTQEASIEARNEELQRERTALNLRAQLRDYEIETHLRRAEASLARLAAVVRGKAES